MVQITAQRSASHFSFVRRTLPPPALDKARCSYAKNLAPRGRRPFHDHPANHQLNPPPRQLRDEGTWLNTIGNDPAKPGILGLEFLLPFNLIRLQSISPLPRLADASLHARHGTNTRSPLTKHKISTRNTISPRPRPQSALTSPKWSRLCSPSSVTSPWRHRKAGTGIIDLCAGPLGITGSPNS
jgi:hypothetical protein